MAPGEGRSGMFLNMVSPIDCGEGSERKRAHKQALGFQNYLGMRALNLREMRERDRCRDRVRPTEEKLRLPSALIFVLYIYSKSKTYTTVFLSVKTH